MDQIDPVKVKCQILKLGIYDLELNWCNWKLEQLEIYRCEAAVVLCPPY